MWAVHIALAAAALYAAVIAGLYFAQTSLLFPTALVGGRIALPAGAERHEVRTPDGEVLVGVRIAAARPNARGPVLLGFGGNAWNAEAMALYLHGAVPESDVVAFHYRGYAPSTGRPSAAALLADAPRVFDRVWETLAPGQVVAVGFSIGAGPAAYLARERPVAGLILVTPFDSLERLARDLYWWVPVGLLLRHRMPVIDFVRETSAPMALIAASRDSIVPARRSAPLRAAIPNLVLDRTIDAGHNDLYDQPAFVEALREALARMADSPRERTPAGRGP